MCSTVRTQEVRHEGLLKVLWSAIELYLACHKPAVTWRASKIFEDGDKLQTVLKRRTQAQRHRQQGRAIA